MTQKQTIAAIKALPGMTARYSAEYQEYRVTRTGLSNERAEAVACYTSCPLDALGTAKAMAAHSA